MRLHSSARGRLPRLVLGIAVLAAMAVTLAACSSPSATTAHHTNTHKVAATPVVNAATSSVAASSASGSASAAAAGPLSGSWKGQYSGAYSGTFSLNWTQSTSNLSGTIMLSYPAGGAIPLHGTVNGSSITFGTVGSTSVTYSGSVSGNSMSGTYQVQGSGGGNWSASRS